MDKIRAKIIYKYKVQCFSGFSSPVLESMIYVRCHRANYDLLAVINDPGHFVSFGKLLGLLNRLRARACTKRSRQTRIYHAHSMTPTLRFCWASWCVRVQWKNDGGGQQMAANCIPLFAKKWLNEVFGLNVGKKKNLLQNFHN